MIPWTLLLTLLAFAPLSASGSKTIETIGDIGQYAVPLSAMVSSICLRDAEGLGQYAISSTATMATVYAVKYSVNRKRPKHGCYSFPSGHTASAFMGAAYLSRRYGMRYAWPHYLAASFVGFSRVYAQKHYASDVAASIAISLTISHFLIQPKCKHVHVCPFFDKRGSGISISCPIGGT